MIIDLNLGGKTVLVIGGGAEAQKRARGLLGQGCKVVVAAAAATPALKKMAASGRITLVKKRVRDAAIIAEVGPDLVIAATDDGDINGMIVRAAKRRRILSYRADSPADSDYANPAVISIGGVVQASISTGGRSPAMSKKIRQKAEAALRGAITPEDIMRIRVQEYARGRARQAIPTQAARRRYLGRVLRDAGIDQLIKDGRLRDAQRRAAGMLGDVR